MWTLAAQSAGGTWIPLLVVYALIFGGFWYKITYMSLNDNGYQKMYCYFIKRMIYYACLKNNILHIVKGDKDHAIF